jgi:hypothetical protein
MLPEVLRVAVSIKTGVILPSGILRRMNAFRKLGRVPGTMPSTKASDLRQKPTSRIHSVKSAQMP